MTGTKEPLWPLWSAGRGERDVAGGFLSRCRELTAEVLPRIRSIAAVRETEEALLTKEILSLCRSVEGRLPDPAHKTIQFVGAHAGAGVSFLARAFALTAAQRLGKSVLLIDAARHNPTQHLHFDLVAAQSWCDVVKSGARAEKACHQVGRSTLFLCTAPPHPSEELDLSAVGTFLGALRNSFDYILIDSSPPPLSPESLLLARHVDGVVLVVEAERTRWPVALALKEQTEQNGGTVLGMIFNKRRHHIPGFLYRRL